MIHRNQIKTLEVNSYSFKRGFFFLEKQINIHLQISPKFKY